MPPTGRPLVSLPRAGGALADLSRCKRLPGIAVNRALVWQQVTAAIGTTSDVLAAGPDNAGYRGLGPRFCSQRYCNSLTGTSDDRPRSQAAVNQPTRNSAPPSTGSATPVMKLASTHARGFSSPLVGPRSRFLASSRWTCSRFLVSSCRPSRFLVSSCRLLTVPRVFLASSCRIDTLDVSNFLLFRRV